MDKEGDYIKQLKQFTAPVFNYYLHFWGQIMNGGLNKKLFRTDKTDFWFPDDISRKKYKKLLSDIAKENNVRIVFAEYEGELCKRRTVAKMIFEFEGKEYPYTEDFGYGYPVQAAEYMFFGGDYSCDCNKSLFIKRTHDKNFPEMDCGHRIKIKDFVINFEE